MFRISKFMVLSKFSNCLRSSSIVENHHILMIKRSTGCSGRRQFSYLSKCNSFILNSTKNKYQMAIELEEFVFRQHQFNVLCRSMTSTKDTEDTKNTKDTKDNKDIKDTTISDKTKKEETNITQTDIKNSIQCRIYKKPTSKRKYQTIDKSIREGDLLNKTFDKNVLDTVKKEVEKISEPSKSDAKEIDNIETIKTEFDNTNDITSSAKKSTEVHIEYVERSHFNINDFPPNDFKNSDIETSDPMIRKLIQRSRMDIKNRQYLAEKLSSATNSATTNTNNNNKNNNNINNNNNDTNNLIDYKLTTQEDKKMNRNKARLNTKRSNSVPYRPIIRANLTKNPRTSKNFSEFTNKIKTYDTRTQFVDYNKSNSGQMFPDNNKNKQFNKYKAHNTKNMDKKFKNIRLTNPDMKSKNSYKKNEMGLNENTSPYDHRSKNKDFLRKKIYTIVGILSMFSFAAWLSQFDSKSLPLLRLNSYLTFFQTKSTIYHSHDDNETITSNDTYDSEDLDDSDDSDGNYDNHLDDSKDN